MTDLTDMQIGEKRIYEGVELIALPYKGNTPLLCSVCHFGKDSSCPSKDDAYQCSESAQAHIGSALFINEDEYLKRRLRGEA